ncbi:9365_t:CDS:2 [Acaulospora colombiana]|uniref:9365_t:CDS:1 n=1 Tax=Acaulospora colombiana TaxID=27376 RepID=A0ACA9K551_9GLOM|nr:9365_t:CDS:2 [Acaulospora colombiana]
MKLRPFVLALLPFAFSLTSLVLGEKSTQQHFEEGDEHFMKGNYDEALKSFDAAISQDPTNYLYIFKRAATYIQLKQSSAAVQDFTKILKLNPDFEPALLQRAKYFLKEGSLNEAKGDLQRILNKKENVEAGNSLKSIISAEKLIENADEALKTNDYDTCIEKISKAIKISSRSLRLRLTRAQCHLGKGEIEEAVRDLSVASQLKPDDSNMLIRLCRLNYFSLYNPEQARNNLKQCLRYDPEQKLCKNLHRLIKKIEKKINKVSLDIEGKGWQTAINKLLGLGGSNKGQGLVPEVENELKNIKEGLQKKELLVKLYGWTCKSYQELKDGQKAIKWCSDTLNMDENSVEALISRAEAYVIIEDYEAALKDYTKAHELTQGQDKRVIQGRQRVDKLLKQSKKKDYYKILGVPRTANKKDIKRAYRKLAQEWHPDKYRGDLTPEQVDSKMSSINEAYEVLSDDDLRAKYDNGEDPNDPNGGSQPFFYTDNVFMRFASGGFQFGDADTSKSSFEQFNFSLFHPFSTICRTLFL